MKIIVVLLTFLTGFTTFAQLTWVADPAHSRIGFEIGHWSISSLDGRFRSFNVTAKANSAFSNPKFDVTIQTGSIDTDNPRRDNDLRSEAYFSAEQYPTITFKSTGFGKIDNNKFKLTGDLTIRGVTQSVTLEGKLNGIITDIDSQRFRAGLKLTGVINRIDFGVGRRTRMLSNEVLMVIKLEMLQQ